MIRVRHAGWLAILVTGVVWIGDGGASAAPSAGTTGAAYAACMQQANSTADMQQCQKAGLAEANGRMEAALRKALALLPVDQQAKLRASQRLWTTFRLSDCRVFYGNETGTIATVQGGGCMIDRTETRIKELAGFSLR